MAADLSRVAVSPGAFDEGAAGVGVAGLGDAAQAAHRATGVFAGGEAQVAHELAGVIEAGKIPEFSNESERDGELHAAQGLDSFHDRTPAPGFDRRLEFALQALEAVLVFGDRPHVLLEDDLLGWGRTDDLGEPSQVSRAPAGAPLIADILPQQESFEAVLGGLEIGHGILASAAEVPNGLVFDCWDIDRGEVAGAHEPSQLHGIAPISLDPVTGFSRAERRGDHPAGELVLGQIAIEPVPAGTRLINEEELAGFALELADELVDVALTGADGAEGEDLGARGLGNVGNGDSFLVDIKTDEECVRIVYG